MSNFLRAISPNRIGGILIPYNQKDRYGTWWNQQSDLVLSLFRARPLLYWHGLRSGKPSRAGDVLDSTLEVRPEGLYGEAEVWDTPEGNAIMALLDAGDAAGSTGAWPVGLRVRESDGYVECWPLAEWSIAPTSAVVSQPQSTRVMHVRSYLSQVADIADVQLQRSLWMTENGTGQNGTAQPSAPPAVDTQAMEAAITRAVAQAVDSRLADLPGRLLPAGTGDMLRALTAQHQPQIQVASPYDGVSLLGLLVWDKIQFYRAQRDARFYQREDTFMRAVLDKMNRAIAAEKPMAAYDLPPLRAVSPDAEMIWRKRLPNLRADEAMQATLVSGGDELVPTLMSSVALYAFMMESRVAGLLDSFQMPSNDFTQPFIGAGLTVRRVVEPSDQSQLNLGSTVYSPSKPATSLITWSCKDAGIGAMAIVSQTLLQDAAISVSDMLATEWARRMAAAIDYVLINGDESATATNIGHYGADPTGTDYDKILVLDGLRHIASANSDATALNGSIAIGSLMTYRKLMGSRGIIGLDKQNLVVVADPNVAYQLLGLAEYRTYDKAGPAASILTGEVARWDDVPVVVTDELEYTTNATNRIPAAHNGTDAQFLVLHRRLNRIGYRPGLGVEVGPQPHTGLVALSGTVRLDVQCIEAGGVAHCYDVTP